MNFYQQIVSLGKNVIQIMIIWGKKKIYQQFPGEINKKETN